MNLRSLLLAAVPAVLFVSAACGDGSGEAEDVSPTADPADFGPAPALGGNITKVSPAHAATVSRAATITTNQLDPKGVCVNVNFEGLPNYGQSFRFIVDETDVTAGGDTSWIVPTRQNPTDGVLCYAPPGGLAPGRHTAAVGVQDPNSLTAPFKQTVAWAFQVSE